MAELNYGMNGSKELLAWGHESAVYFRNLVPKTTRVIEAGNPRLDEQLMQDYMEDINSIRANVPLGTHNLLYVSNPVDDQGFCSYSQKLDLFRKFVIACREVCTETNTSILVRLHPREFENDFSTVIDELACGDWVVIVHGYPLFALLKVVDLTVILASTVGLESMACGVPVAVIKIPGFGFVHDYHRSGAAIGFDLEQPDEVAGLLRQTLKRPAEKANFVLEEYVDSHISNLGCSKEYICRRITELASN